MYNFQSSNIDFGDLRYSTAIAFYICKFLSIPIAFSRNTEKKREGISYAPYILIMMLVIPFAITIVFTLINAFVFHHHISYNIFWHILQLWFIKLKYCLDDFKLFDSIKTYNSA